MAGVLRGAPVLTLDLDLVHRRTPENVKRLLQVLVRRRERANECAIDWAACLSR